MPMKEQKEFVHLLIRMQNGLRLTIGPMGDWPLNYEMASNVSIARFYIFNQNSNYFRID